MRVVSMVPSWTETLITAGIEVVGRTRYCIHPAEAVAAIPTVGGTKDWDWDKIQKLEPDLIILDQEENPLFMAEQTEIPFLATHVTSITDMPSELQKLSATFNNDVLATLANEWSELKPFTGEIPGVIEWGRRPSSKIQTTYYVIWRDPWMVVSRDTFVGSMLSLCGVQMPQLKAKYPELKLEELSNKEETLLLFSCEPYPFLKRQQGLAELGHPYAIVDGENFSWFGVRSLRFLQGL